MTWQRFSNPAQTRISFQFFWFAPTLLVPPKPLTPFPHTPHQTNTTKHLSSPFSLRNPNPKEFVMKGGKPKADTKKADNKLSVKKKPTGGERAGKKPARKEKAVKDPNKPKRPASAFFVFMEEFRTQYKEKHPNNKAVSVVGKAGGDKWKSMSDAEKAPYVAKAEKRKIEYNKNMQAYNKKQAEGANAADDEEESFEKSKSEVSDEDEDDSGEEEEDSRRR
ncbi:hypothetical protein NE237_023731 [Protea cynaroides]|uniref:HMG box domain-containing protein n=1 Tax=Protea cynaroides TaxID=273540 RepID=A0A9Q0HGU5_9MAGN|nr:hypothetical protein NE237_023731 [Protea cynaroides]